MLLFRLTTILEERHKRPDRGARPLLHSSALDPSLQKIAELADRVFCFHEARGHLKAEPKMQEAQKPLRPSQD
jgi:hypothetical protein